MKIAIIDLGANSFHLVIFDVHSQKKIVPLQRRSYINSLGASLDGDNRILPSAITHSVATVDALYRHARRNNAGIIKIFGTSIFRRAVNSIQLVDAVFKKTGCVVDILSEEEEARIIFEALKNQYTLRKKSLIIDIGGGSSEFIMAQRKKMKWYTSIPLGVAHITSQLKKSRRNSVEKLRKKVIHAYTPVISFLGGHRFDTCYGSCGFLRLIALALKKDAMKNNRNFTKPVMLTTTDINRALLLARTHKIYVTDPEKEKIVYAGSLIVLSLMQKLRLKEILVPSASTREGYLIHLIHQGVIR